MTDKFDHISIKNFSITKKKKVIDKIKRYMINRGKIFTIHMTKEFNKLVRKKSKNPVEKWVKEIFGLGFCLFCTTETQL